MCVRGVSDSSRLLAVSMVELLAGRLKQGGHRPQPLPPHPHSNHYYPTPTPTITTPPSLQPSPPHPHPNHYYLTPHPNRRHLTLTNRVDQPSRSAKGCHCSVLTKACVSGCVYGKTQRSAVLFAFEVRREGDGRGEEVEGHGKGGCVGGGGGGGGPLPLRW